eukprot:2198594-Ditylum_brightwellii.AAC.1
MSAPNGASGNTKECTNGVSVYNNQPSRGVLMLVSQCPVASLTIRGIYWTMGNQQSQLFQKL